MNLTDQEIYKIMAMHIGCEVITDEGLGKLVGVNLDHKGCELPSPYVVYLYLGDGCSEYISWIKLNLNDYKTITDSMVFGLAKIIGLEVPPGAVISRKEDLVTIDWEQHRRQILYKQLNSSCYQHLLNNYYPVGLYFGPGHWANGKTAVDLGIARVKVERY